MTPDHFFDTSAIGKHYHREVGSTVVNHLLMMPASRQNIARLTVVEFHSSLAKKVRTGRIPIREFHASSIRFQADILAKRFAVIRVTVPHFLTAERLVRRISTTRNPRTLDALQLAVAIFLKTPERPITLVSADQALCAIAQSEGLAAINPELP